jgi:hypothetical protein
MSDEFDFEEREGNALRSSVPKAKRPQSVAATTHVAYGF